MIVPALRDISTFAELAQFFLLALLLVQQLAVCTVSRRRHSKFWRHYPFASGPRVFQRAIDPCRRWPPEIGILEHMRRGISSFQASPIERPAFRTVAVST